MQKIRSQKDIISLARRLKKSGNTIALISGCFDILHKGHVHVLEESKKQGDVLVVLLNSDRSVKSYKGPTRPIVGEKDRATVLAALRAVDYVVLFNERVPLALVEAIQPDVYCNGSDWGTDFPERKVVEAYGGRIHLIKIKKGTSTSSIIDKILKKGKK